MSPFRKALGVSGFPNDDIISEFLDPKDTLPPDSHFKQWKMPQLQTIQVNSIHCSMHVLQTV